MKSTTSTTLKALSTQTVVTIATAVITLIVFSIMSRLLSKEDFGYYAVISAITTIFNTLTEAGMGSAVIQRGKIFKEYIDTAFTLSAITGFLFSTTLILLAPVIAKLIADESIILPLRFMSISVLFCSLNSVTKANMTRELDFKRIGVFNMITMVLSALIAIAMAANGFGVYAIIAQTVTAAIFTFVVFYLKLENKPHWFYVSKTCVKEIFSYGGWLTASCIFRVLYQQMDKLLTGKWLSITLLGAYNRPSGFISHISSNINGIMDTVLFPILSSIQDDTEKIRRAYDKLIYMINLYSGILCVLFFVSNKIVIDIFFGPEWEDLSVVFNIISLTLLLSANGRIMDCFIRSLAFVKMGFYLRLIACLVTFACLYIGKDFGIIGVALSVVISNIIIIFTKMFYIGYKVNVSTLHTIYLMFKPLSISVPPFFVYLLLRSQTNSSNTISILLGILFIIYYIMVFCLFPNPKIRNYHSIHD